MEGSENNSPKSSDTNIIVTSPKYSLHQVKTKRNDRCCSVKVVEDLRDIDKIIQKKNFKTVNTRLGTAERDTTSFCDHETLKLKPNKPIVGSTVEFDIEPGTKFYKNKSPIHYSNKKLSDNASSSKMFKSASKSFTRTYSRRKHFHESHVNESFGLPDEPILPSVVPVVRDKLDVEEINVSDINLYGLDFLNAPWQINSTEYDLIFDEITDIRFKGATDNIQRKVKKATRSLQHNIENVNVQNCEIFTSTPNSKTKILNGNIVLPNKHQGDGNSTKGSLLNSQSSPDTFRLSSHITEPSLSNLSATEKANDKIISVNSISNKTTNDTSSIEKDLKILPETLLNNSNDIKNTCISLINQNGNLIRKNGMTHLNCSKKVIIHSKNGFSKTIKVYDLIPVTEMENIDCKKENITALNATCINSAKIMTSTVKNASEVEKTVKNTIVPDNLDLASSVLNNENSSPNKPPILEETNNKSVANNGELKTQSSVNDTLEVNTENQHRYSPKPTGKSRRTKKLNSIAYLEDTSNKLVAYDNDVTGLTSVIETQPLEEVTKINVSHEDSLMTTPKRSKRLSRKKTTKQDTIKLVANDSNKINHYQITETQSLQVSDKINLTDSPMQSSKRSTRKKQMKNLPTLVDTNNKSITSDGENNSTAHEPQSLDLNNAQIDKSPSSFNEKRLASKDTNGPINLQNTNNKSITNLNDSENKDNSIAPESQSLNISDNKIDKNNAQIEKPESTLTGIGMSSKNKKTTDTPKLQDTNKKTNIPESSVNETQAFDTDDKININKKKTDSPKQTRRSCRRSNKMNTSNLDDTNNGSLINVYQSTSSETHIMDQPKIIEADVKASPIQSSKRSTRSKQRKNPETYSDSNKSITGDKKYSDIKDQSMALKPQSLEVSDNKIVNNMEMDKPKRKGKSPRRKKIILEETNNSSVTYPSELSVNENQSSDKIIDNTMNKKNQKTDSCKQNRSSTKKTKTIEDNANNISITSMDESSANAQLQDNKINMTNQKAKSSKKTRSSRKSKTIEPPLLDVTNSKPVTDSSETSAANNKIDMDNQNRRSVRQTRSSQRKPKTTPVRNKNKSKSLNRVDDMDVSDVSLQRTLRSGKVFSSPEFTNVLDKTDPNLSPIGNVPSSTPKANQNRKSTSRRSKSLNKNESDYIEEIAQVLYNPDLTLHSSQNRSNDIFTVEDEDVVYTISNSKKSSFLDRSKEYQHNTSINNKLSSEEDKVASSASNHDKMATNDTSHTENLNVELNSKNEDDSALNCTPHKENLNVHVNSSPSRLSIAFATNHTPNQETNALLKSSPRKLRSASLLSPEHQQLMDAVQDDEPDEIDVNQPSSRKLRSKSLTKTAEDTGPTNDNDSLLKSQSLTKSREEHLQLLENIKINGDSFFSQNKNVNSDIDEESKKVIQELLLNDIKLIQEPKRRLRSFNASTERLDTVVTNKENGGGAKKLLNDNGITSEVRVMIEHIEEKPIKTECVKKQHKDRLEKSNKRKDILKSDVKDEIIYTQLELDSGIANRVPTEPQVISTDNDVYQGKEPTPGSTLISNDKQKEMNILKVIGTVEKESVEAINETSCMNNEDLKVVSTEQEALRNSYASITDTQTINGEFVNTTKDKKDSATVTNELFGNIDCFVTELGQSTVNSQEVPSIADTTTKKADHQQVTNENENTDIPNTSMLNDFPETNTRDESIAQKIETCKNTINNNLQSDLFHCNDVKTHINDAPESNTVDKPVETCEAATTQPEIVKLGAQTISDLPSNGEYTVAKEGVFITKSPTKTADALLENSKPSSLLINPFANEALNQDCRASRKSLRLSRKEELKEKNLLNKVTVKTEKDIDAVEIKSETDTDEESVSTPIRKSLRQPKKEKNVDSNWEMDIKPSKEAIDRKIKDENDIDIKPKNLYFELGAIVWTRIGGFPYWPSLVQKDPVSGIHIRQNASLKTVQYHVRFFADNGRRAWIRHTNMLPYNSKEDLSTLKAKLLSQRQKNAVLIDACTIRNSWRKKWEEAIEEAESVKEKSDQEKFDFFDKVVPIAQEDENASSVNKKQQNIKRKRHPSESPSRKRIKVELSDETDELCLTQLSDETGDETESKTSESSYAEAVAFQNILFNRNNLFKGVTRERVCQVCFKSDEVFRCRGRCYGSFHIKCALTITEEKIDIKEEFKKQRGRRSNEHKRGSLKSTNTTTGNNDVEIKKDGEVGETDTDLKENSNSPTKSINEGINHDSKSLSELVNQISIHSPLNEVYKNPTNLSNENIKDEKPVSEGNVEIITIISNIRHTSPKKIFPPNFKNMSLAEQIDYKMKEIMRKFVDKTAYASTSTTDVSSDETSDKNFVEQAVHTLFINSPPSGNVVSENNVPGGSSSISSPQKVDNVLVIKREPEQGQENSLIDGAISKKDRVFKKNKKTKYQTANETKGIMHVTADTEHLQNIPGFQDVISISNFKCDFCISTTLVPFCLICSKSVSPRGSNIRQKCSLSYCGKYFHQECLKSWPQTQWTLTQTIIRDNIVDSFVCPLHSCHTCVSEDPRMACMNRCSSDKLVRCLCCPASYHMSSLCIPAGSEILSTSQIICPRHGTHQRKHPNINVNWCFLCPGQGPLICCESCPMSAHQSCITKKFDSEEAFICEECQSGKLPLYDEIVWCKLGNYRWWPGVILYPNEIPENILRIPHDRGEFVVKFYGTYDHHWMHRGRIFQFHDDDTAHTKHKHGIEQRFTTAVEEATNAHRLKKEFRQSKQKSLQKESKPPPYIKIKINKPVGNVRQFDPNLSNTTACECDPKTENPCGPDSDCLNRLLLTECNPDVCPAGKHCKNQCFEKKEYPPLVPYKTESRGWGLKTLASVKKGQFVIEYVGELIDETEYQRRIAKMHECMEENYYFLTIDKDRMLDAGPKGNVARFMNHSCQPNCETQKWTINGDTRVGLFATQNIEADTELTFNYNLECVGKEKKVCKCGAPNCSGFIGLKVKTNENVKKSKKPIKKKLVPSPGKVNTSPCFICGRKGSVRVCNNKICNKSYHLRCLRLTTWPEGNKFVCPWHNCNMCSKRTIRCCVKCINSYCPQHSQGNIRHDYRIGFICSEHDTAIEAIDPKKPVHPKIAQLTDDSTVTSTTSEDEWIPNQKRKLKKKKRISLLEEDNLTEDSESTVSSASISELPKTSSKRLRDHRRSSGEDERLKKKTKNNENPGTSGVSYKVKSRDLKQSKKKTSKLSLPSSSDLDESVTTKRARHRETL